MKIEEGKYYCDRDGDKYGPMSVGYDPVHPATDGDWSWTLDGKFIAGGRHVRDLVAEWTEDPDTPKLWRDMTPEEKGALLLAHHEGNEIEIFLISSQKWSLTFSPHWYALDAYRIKPEPKRETVTLSGRYFEPEDRWVWASMNQGKATHEITFDLIDGKPDCDTIRMEKL